MKYTFFNQINSIFISALIAVGLSILFLIAVQFFSSFMNNFVIIAGLAMIILMVIFTVLQKNINMTILIIFSIVMVALFVIIMLGAFKSRQCFDLHGIFLKYATKVISNRPSILIYILIFTGIFVLFLMLVALELKSLWSFSSIYYEPESVYYKFTSGSTTFFSLLVGVQVVWGCSFIQLACTHTFIKSIFVYQETLFNGTISLTIISSLKTRTIDLKRKVKVTASLVSSHLLNTYSNIILVVSLEELSWKLSFSSSIISSI